MALSAKSQAVEIERFTAFRESIFNKHFQLGTAAWITKGALPSFVGFAGQKKPGKIRYLNSFRLWQGITNMDEFFGFAAHES